MDNLFLKASNTEQSEKAVKKAISVLENNLSKERYYKEKMVKISEGLEECLNKMHLTIKTVSPVKTGHGENWTPGDYLKVNLRVAPLNNKFKFIKDRGYTASGRGRNESNLRSKAEKIEEKIKTDTFIESVMVNQFSLETKDDRDCSNQNILIDFWVK
jgi:hypothetical protein